MHTVIFDITGMNCAACSARVEKSVSVLAGVRDVAVNLLKNTLTLSADPELVSTADVVAAVTKAGYGATLRVAGKDTKAALSSAPQSGPPPDPAAIALAALRRRLAVSLTFTVPLFLLVMGPMAGLPLPGFFQGAENALAFALTQFLLALPVLFACGALYRTGFKALLSGAPNMDSLIAIGSGAAALFSVCAFYEMAFALGRGDLATVARFAANLYFDSAAMILTLITLGRFFEARAKGRTSEAITKLMDLAPRTATLLRDGEERVIPRDAVVPGDILVVRTGERVPVDGVITSGSGFLDESALSGESLPLEKQAGDTVTGATINTSGYFLMRATRVGEDTTLAQIIRLVDEATSSKAPIARLADRVSGIFVPVVIVIALSATAFWLLCGYGAAFALSIGIAVLVISCPCALGLATPTAIMVGAGRGASLGILLKSAEAIETAGIVDTVVLDKTGTVTEGRPALTDLIPAEPADAAEAVDATELLTLAASLEKLSEHPLGAAIVREAETRGLTLRPVSGFTRMPGQGIAGTMDGEGYAAGNAKLLAARGVADSLAEQAEKLAAEGRTALYVLRGARLLGCIAVADAVKAGSSGAVAELAGMGIAVIMLTGDNAVTAAAVARQVGIGTVVAGVSPQDKEREIRALQEAGHHVAMVGDGVNDAPALARADVGIAIGAGTDVALESADIVLMKSELPDAVAAIRLSRAVMRAIRQNLFWAFFYNCIGIPVAAGALYPAFGWTLSPVLGAAAMGISSVCVVTNALRLRWTPLRPAGDTQHSVPARKNSMKKTIKIEGMNCGHCSASVERALKALAGVSAVQVDLASKSATLEVAGVSDAVLAKAVTDAGFEVVGIN